MIDWLKLVWIFLPPAVANMTPIVVMKIWPKWNQPLDFGKSFLGVRIFGDHKTLRGMIGGIIVAEIVFLAMGTKGLPWYFGGLLGFGALGGDAVKSFFKRRAGVASGRSWFPWDQIDWIFGFVIMAQAWQILNFVEIGVLLLTGFVLHLIFKLMGYFFKFHRTII